ncbi:HIRAN domain-containing protein [Bacillaceae bacterium W0354]
MEVIKSLLVIWKNKKDDLYYHIGTLNYDGSMYRFIYSYHSKSPRKVHDALNNGFHLHPAFPELEKVYQSSTLFEAFDRRIPDKGRVDYQEVLTSLGLPPTADRMDILRETRGMISGDPYSFEEPLRLEDKELITNFYINGMRHQEHLPVNWYDYLTIGEELIPFKDNDNPIDQFAIKIKTKNDMELGYIPGIYAQAVYALLSRGVHVSLKVLDICHHMAPQWWVRVELKSTVDLPEYDNFYDYELEGLIFKVA